MGSDQFSVKFFGVRGSHPAMGSQYARYGGHTATLMVTLAGRRIALDGGLGLLPLGQELPSDQEHLIFLTHLHYDHLMGLPFFPPLFVQGAKVRILAPRVMLHDLEQYWSPPFFPVRRADLPARVTITAAPEGEVSMADMLGLPYGADSPTLQTLFLDGRYHPLEGVMLYRINWQGKSLVYATDVEVATPELFETVARFCDEADILICDAQYEDAEYRERYRGWGHNPLSMTLALAEQAKAGQLVLFHHSPQREDSAVDALQESARRRFPNALAAYEGLVLHLRGSEAE